MRQSASSTTTHSRAPQGFPQKLWICSGKRRADSWRELLNRDCRRRTATEVCRWHGRSGRTKSAFCDWLAGRRRRSRGHCAWARRANAASACGWRRPAWASEPTKALQREWLLVEGRNGDLSQMQRRHHGLPTCGYPWRKLRLLGRRHRDFSGDRFPICLQACCHGLTSCPGPDSAVRLSRQVIKRAACPGLSWSPTLDDEDARLFDALLEHPGF